MAWNITFTFDLDEESKSLETKFNDELCKQGFTPFKDNSTFSLQNDLAQRHSHAIQSAKHKVRLALEVSKVKISEFSYQAEEETEASAAHA